MDRTSSSGYLYLINTAQVADRINRLFQVIMDHIMLANEESENSQLQAFKNGSCERKLIFNTLKTAIFVVLCKGTHLFTSFNECAFDVYCYIFKIINTCTIRILGY